MTNVTSFWLIFVDFLLFIVIFVGFLSMQTSFSSRLFVIYVLFARHWDGPGWLPSSVESVRSTTGGCGLPCRRLE